ncbi:MAG: GPW/gp25 family protein [Bacteroidia bacterium]
MDSNIDTGGILGRGWAWPPAFDHNTGEVAMLSGEADIRNSLEIMLATHPGERDLAPVYGANMQDMVFTPMDRTTQTIMKSRLVDRIHLNEPRVVAEDVRFEQDQIEGSLIVHLTYRVIATNNRYNLVYPYYLDGGKEVGG